MSTLDPLDSASAAPIDLSPELGDVLDSILRDLEQVVQYDHVRILLLTSVLNPTVPVALNAAIEADTLITVRDRGSHQPSLASMKIIPPDLFPLNRRLLTEQQPIVIGDTANSSLWVKDGSAPGIHAWIGAPLVVKGKSIGILTVHSSTVNAYTQRDGSVVFAFANQAAEAIDKVQLLEQAQSRLRAMQALRNISLQMTASLDLDRVLDAICENVLQLTEAEDTHIFLYDAELDEFNQSVALWRSGERRPAVSKPRRGGLTDRVRSGGQTIVIDNAPEHELYSTPEALKWGIKSIAGFPLKAGQRVLGVFTVAYTVLHHFGEDELRVLNLLADQAAIALENARLYAVMQHQLTIQSRLYSVITLLRSTLNLDEILSTVASAVSDLLDLKSCSVGLLDDDLTTWSIYATAGARPQVEDIPIAWIPAELYDPVWAATSLTIVNLPQLIDQVIDPQQTYGLAVGQTLLLCPIVGQAKVLGLIGLVSAALRTFAPDEVDLLRALANQASAAIGNARLYAETQVRLATQSRLYEVSTLLRSTLNVDEVLNAVATTLFDLYHPAVCTMSLIDLARGVITYPVVRGGQSVPPDIPLASLPQQLVERGLAGQITILDSLEQYPEMQQMYQLPPHVGMVVVPIVGQKQTQGVITLITKDRPRFQPDQMELITALANQAAIAIENALAYRALQAALAERERTQQALIRSESLAAVGQLVAGVAHELNNPLATVSSLVQSALETLGMPYRPVNESSGKLPALRPDKMKPLAMEDMIEIGEDLAFSLKELRRAKSIVAALLDLSRQSSSYTEEVSLTVVCQDALRILFNKLKPLPLEISEKYVEDLPAIRGNFANLGQVALNIIQNAAEAFDKKPGHIELGTYVDRARDVVGFYVTDDGPGIAPEVLPNIFNPFFTTKKVGIGTGLGLYLSYEIVHRHGGEIVVETEEGQGATFKVEIPRQIKDEGTYKG